MRRGGGDARFFFFFFLTNDKNAEETNKNMNNGRSVGVRLRRDETRPSERGNYDSKSQTPKIVRKRGGVKTMRNKKRTIYTCLLR